MDRGDILLVGCGGGGSSLVDAIINVDSKFEGFFFNTSSTDIESLDNANSDIKNYYIIATQNGVGRNKDKGRMFAEARVMNMIDILNKYQQKVIYLVTSFGGGSGSSITGVILDTICQLQESGVEFNKTINVIGILPDLKSDIQLLKNTEDTWNDIMSKSCVNNVIFVDNNSHIEAEEIMTRDEKEHRINEEFALLFDAIFDIPVDNGKLFDSGNLSNILNDRGCIYVYELPDDCSSINVAFNSAKKNSVFADMHISENNTIIENEASEKIICGHIGLSLSNNRYNPESLLNKFSNKKEVYIGKNFDNRNIVLLSGMYPPLDTINRIINEASVKETYIKKDLVDFQSFITAPIKETENKIINKPLNKKNNLQALKNNPFKRKLQ